MTVPAQPDGGTDRLLHLLVRSDQLREWSDWIERLRADGRHMAVAYGPDRRTEGRQLASALSARVAPLSAVGSLESHLRRHDLLVTLSSAGGGQPSLQPVGGFSALHRLLHAGVMIWGITGPRPNPISPYCHDSLAVPESEPSLLLRGHRLVVRRLMELDRPSSPALARMAEGSRR